ncbi:MAG: type II secretion system protein GspD [Patiriisocius sp.]|uniref:type II secretion system protein GspD n=1 Tax=Patiriisocius sp. TaxID=2822396 RepID=UPI003EF33E8E
MISFQILAQSNEETITSRFEQIAESRKGLNEAIRIDISGLTLYDFISAIAEEHELNVSVDSSLNDVVSSNFFDVNVKDVFLFLIRKYDLDVEIINGIISFSRKKPEEVKPPPPVVKTIDINYNPQNDFLSLKLKNDSLPLVAKKITEVSNKNVVLSPDIKTMNVSGYMLNRPFDQVIEMLAKSNDLIVTRDENDFYFLEKMTVETAALKNDTKRNNGKVSVPKSKGQLQISVNENGYLNVQAYETDLTSLIMEAAEKLNINYFFYDKPKDEITTLFAKEIDFDGLLENAFKGKDFAYNKVDDLYFLGKQNTEGLRVTELIQLENRTVELVLETLPKDLIEGLDVKQILELNGIMVSGSKRRLAEVKAYIREIDKVVPMIQIEVLIVQYQKSYDIQTGLQAILGEQGADVKTGGVIFPTTDVVVNSNTINDLIESFNGFGIFNLGKVTKDFYANLTAMESNSIVNIQSTPKIATLNGHEASISIGETNYYFEQTNRLINTGVNDNILQSGQWKPTEANLGVFIKPFVSKDEQVTLEISVEKSAFLGRAGENAPPDKATQKFESLVRVRNNEMILLGGLDELDRQNSGTGTPFLSRIPIIKWFFSSKRKAKSKSKLHVFIKPTIVY